MSVISEETKQNAESTTSEESENEKKIRKENENLIKEIESLTEKKLELEVSVIYIILYAYICVIQKYIYI
jgi:predicted solute-binding protein